MEALKNNSQAIVRALTVAVAVVLQAITMVLVGRYLHEYASWAYVLLEIISFLLVFGLINDQESYRQFWCVIVLVFPVTGLFLYYMWGQRRRNSKTHILIRETEAKMRQYVPHQPEVMEELQGHFRPEFLNRLDEIIMFKPLSKNNIGNIIKLMMDDLNKRLADRDIHVALTPNAQDYIVEHGYDPVYGARPLKRFLQKHVETLSAKLILEDKVQQGDTIQIDATDGQLTATVAQ